MIKTDKKSTVKVNTFEDTKSSVKSTKPKAKFTEFVPKIQKRDGNIVGFDAARIEKAIYKAMLASEEGSPEEAELVANKVIADLVRIAKRFPNFLPSVEGVQDSVEKELILSDYVKTSKSYILYRAERAKLRDKGVAVPENVRKLFKESRKYLRNNLAEFVFYTAYARWREEDGRRETWVESIDRYMDFIKENLGKKLT